MNYYEILGVEKSATKDDIKRAFKKLVVKYHPDKNPNNPQADEFFMMISEANQTLSDDNKRANYDSRFIQNAYQRQYEAILDEQEKQRKAAVYKAFYAYYQEYKTPINHKKYRYLYGVFAACLLGMCLVGYFLKKSMDSYSSEKYYHLAKEYLQKKNTHLFHKNIAIARNLGESQKNDVLYVRGVVTQEFVAQKGDHLLEEIKKFENAFTGKNKDEYTFLLGVVEYHKGNKEGALTYFQNARKSYSEADWYYYVGILQAELHADENLCCHYLEIASKMGEARAQAALASYCW